MSTGASGGTSATEGNCEKGIGASVDKSGVVPCCDDGSADKFGVVPCCDDGSADKSGELAVACCDVPCGDATEVKGALPRDSMISCILPSRLIWSQGFCRKLGTSGRFELGRLRSRFLFHRRLRGAWLQSLGLSGETRVRGRL